jgi:hypothetical protein
LSTTAARSSRDIGRTEAGQAGNGFASRPAGSHVAGGGVHDGRDGRPVPEATPGSPEPGPKPTAAGAAESGPGLATGALATPPVEDRDDATASPTVGELPEGKVPEPADQQARAEEVPAIGEEAPE